MSESLDKSVAVLATEMSFLTREVREYRVESVERSNRMHAENIERNNEMKKSIQAADDKMDALKSSFDLIKGGYAVLAFLGTFAVGAAAIFTNVFKGI